MSFVENLTKILRRHIVEVCLLNRQDMKDIQKPELVRSTNSPVSESFDDMEIDFTFSVHRSVSLMEWEGPEELDV